VAGDVPFSAKKRGGGGGFRNDMCANNLLWVNRKKRGISDHRGKKKKGVPVKLNFPEEERKKGKGKRGGFL